MISQWKAFSNPKIEMVWNTVVQEIERDKILTSLCLRNVKIGQPSNLEVDGIFVAVGIKPSNRTLFELVTPDEAGFIVTDELMRTSSPGIFAVGDITRNSFRQVITAAGDGAAAAISAFKYVKE